MAAQGSMSPQVAEPCASPWSSDGEQAAPLVPVSCLLLDSVADIVMAIGPDASVVYVNGAAVRGGWRAEDWLGRSALDVIHPDDVPLAAAAMFSMQDKDVGTPIDLRIAHPSDGWRWFEVVGTNHLDDPLLGVLVLACRDVTERRRWEVVGGDVTRFESVVQHAAAVTMLVDPRGCIDSASGALTRLLGYDPEMIAGRPLAELAAPGYGDVLSAALQQAHGSARAVTAEVPVQPATGGPCRPYRFEIVDLCSDPVIAGFVVTAHDITELQAAREALQRMATHDALTGLPNRLVLAENLASALRDRTARAQVAVMFIDLDRFKPVNDLLGHEAGDELLIDVARRLSGLVRDTDTVVRIGGDEFVIVATGLRSGEAGEVLARDVEQILSEPFTLQAGVARITASVGLSMADGSSTVAGLLADADSAMYQMKNARRSTVFGSSRRMSDRREVAAELVGALDRGEIEAWLQPIVSVDDRRLVGFEALARWRRADGVVLSPGDFFDVADELGLLRAIFDDEILRQACHQLASLDGLDDHLWVSVNMTAADLSDPRLIDVIVDTLALEFLAPHRLAIEVTEQVMLERDGSANGPHLRPRCANSPHAATVWCSTISAPATHRSHMSAATNWMRSRSTALSSSASRTTTPTAASSLPSSDSPTPSTSAPSPKASSTTTNFRCSANSAATKHKAFCSHPHSTHRNCSRGHSTSPWHHYQQRRRARTSNAHTNDRPHGLAPRWCVSVMR